MTAYNLCSIQNISFSIQIEFMLQYYDTESFVGGSFKAIQPSKY